MVVSEDRAQALVGWYHGLHRINAPAPRLKLAGLDPDAAYRVSLPGRGDQAPEIGTFYGDELMNAGILSHPDRSALESFIRPVGDFSSEIFLLEKE